MKRHDGPRSAPVWPGRSTLGFNIDPVIDWSTTWDKKFWLKSTSNVSTKGTGYEQKQRKQKLKRKAHNR